MPAKAGSQATDGVCEALAPASAGVTEKKRWNHPSGSHYIDIFRLTKYAGPFLDQGMALPAVNMNDSRGSQCSPDRKFAPRLTLKSVFAPVAL